MTPTLSSLSRRLAFTALGVVAFVFGLLIVAVLVAAGLVLAAGVLLWSLVSGRRPSSVAWAPARAAARHFFHRRAAATAGSARGDQQVVDVVARDITPRDRSLIRD